MSDFPVATQVTLVICLAVAVVALCWLSFAHDERIEREKEITNRILGTNGVDFQRR